MKRRELLRHLRAHGCQLLREGGRHSWWHNPTLNKRSAKKIKGHRVKRKQKSRVSRNA